jgi:hypothetical protein
VASMAQRTGSVYLDAPARPIRRPPEPRVSHSRVVVAGTCVVIGLVALTMAAMISGIRSMVLDPEPAMAAFESILDDPTARAELEQEIATGIEDSLVGEELAAIVAVFELDVAAEARRLSPLILDDPPIRAELRRLVTDVHSRVVLESATTDVDLAPLTAAMIVLIEQESPRLAAIIPADSTLRSIESGSLPDLTSAADLLDRSLAFALLAVVLIPIGAVIHPRHHRVAAWVGRWALAFGLLCAVAAVGLPYVGKALTGWSAAEPAVRSTSLSLLAPAGLAAVVGMGLISIATVARRREARRVIEEGAAVALGYAEPPLWQQGASPMLDLPTRDLVDASRPLTNI